MIPGNFARAAIMSFAHLFSSLIVSTYKWRIKIYYSKHFMFRKYYTLFLMCGKHKGWDKMDSFTWKHIVWSYNWDIYSIQDKVFMENVVYEVNSKFCYKKSLFFTYYETPMQIKWSLHCRDSFRPFIIWTIKHILNFAWDAITHTCHCHRLNISLTAVEVRAAMSNYINCLYGCSYLFVF